MTTAASPGSAEWNGLGRLGVWSTELRFGDPGFIAEAAAELDELGYGAIWVPGGRDNSLFGCVEALLRATRRATIATGVLNIWLHGIAEAGLWWRALGPERQSRVMLGVGSSHAATIGEAYGRPLQKMSGYLDQMDQAGIPEVRRCLGALGPKMLDLARERSAGAHPYLVTPEHTAAARERLGPHALLAPEQGVILERDPAIARQKAREQLATYAGRPNYTNSWRRLGFSDDDVAGLSDRLVDALFAWGEPERIAERLGAHLEAGADHVCLQVVFGAPGAGEADALRRAWRELAPLTTDVGGRK